jgi:hypothetical protein
MIDTNRHALLHLGGRLTAGKNLMLSLPSMRPTIKRAENIRSTVVMIQMKTLNHIFVSCWESMFDMRLAVGNFN